MASAREGAGGARSRHGAAHGPMKGREVEKCNTSSILLTSRCTPKGRKEVKKVEPSKKPTSGIVWASCSCPVP